jgi:hypothetical protein
MDTIQPALRGGRRSRRRRPYFSSRRVTRQPLSRQMACPMRRTAPPPRTCSPSVLLAGGGDPFWGARAGGARGALGVSDLQITSNGGVRDKSSPLCRAAQHFCRSSRCPTCVIPSPVVSERRRGVVDPSGPPPRHFACREETNSACAPRFFGSPSPWVPSVARSERRRALPPASSGRAARARRAAPRARRPRLRTTASQSYQAVPRPWARQRSRRPSV